MQSTDEEGQVMLNPTRRADLPKDTRPSSAVRRNKNQLATRTNLSGGVGPVRSTRSYVNVSADADLKTKYSTVVKGFKLLESTCRELKGKLADSEERVRYSEQAYTTLKEKAQSDEASHLELVSKMEEKVHSYDVAYANMVSQVQEKACSDEAAFRVLVLKAEEKIQFDAAAHATVVSQMKGMIEVSETAYSELARKLERCERTLKDRESDLNSLHNTIQESVTCGVCQGIPTQPCSAECRHIFCAMCLLSWWQTKRVTSCPTCRAIAKSPPVRDPVQGFVALARAQVGEEEDSDPFDADIFDSFFKIKTRAGSSVQEVIEIS